MQQYSTYQEEQVISEQPLSSLKQIIVSEKYILPYYYEHMNKTIKNPNKPLENEQDNNEEKHFMDYLLEVAERGEITNDFKEQFANINDNENIYTIVDMNPNKSFSYKFKSFVQQLWASNE
jgi:hypothetical protein